jgi:hypothetical protein
MTGAAGPWVLVVGMHRSGTSAVTGALGAVGLNLVHGDDRMEWPESNPEHWESLALGLFNEDLLSRLDGAWDAPPDNLRGWEHSPALADAPDPTPLLEAAYPEPGPKVFKDPRLSLLLPYWRQALPGPVAAVLVWRSPVAVALSLKKRDSLPLADGVALWERYNRRAVDGLNGVDTYVLDYDSVVADGDRSMGALCAWLGSLEQFEDYAGHWDVAAASTAIVGGLVHHPAGDPADPDPLVLSQQQELVHYLAAAGGGHRPFLPSPLGRESAWTTSILRLRQELSGPRRELDAVRDRLRITRKELESTRAGVANLRASTSWRVTAPLRTLTTTLEGLRRHPSDR